MEVKGKDGLFTIDGFEIQGENQEIEDRFKDRFVDLKAYNSFENVTYVFKAILVRVEQGDTVK